MKQQGRADRDVAESAKREPRSYKINEAATADIGIQQKYTRSHPLYRGRGFEAPTNPVDEQYLTGSQGKYK